MSLSVYYHASLLVRKLFPFAGNSYGSGRFYQPRRRPSTAINSALLEAFLSVGFLLFCASDYGTITHFISGKYTTYAILANYNFILGHLVRYIDSLANNNNIIGGPITLKTCN